MGFDPPMFSAAGMFGEEEVLDDTDEKTSTGKVLTKREHDVAGAKLMIYEYESSYTNANLVWPNNSSLALFILDRVPRSARVLELGSGTGILAVFLRREGYSRFVTSDYADDEDIAENIARNCTANGLVAEQNCQHLAYNWGGLFPWAKLADCWGAISASLACQPTPEEAAPDVIIASDILLYVKTYPALVSTLQQLLSARKGTKFFLSAKRRVPDDKYFFELINENGFEMIDHGGRVYEISWNFAK